MGLAIWPSMTMRFGWLLRMVEQLQVVGGEMANLCSQDLWLWSRCQSFWCGCSTIPADGMWKGRQLCLWWRINFLRKDLRLDLKVGCARKGVDEGLLEDGSGSCLNLKTLDNCPRMTERWGCSMFWPMRYMA